MQLLAGTRTALLPAAAAVLAIAAVGCGSSAESESSPTAAAEAGDFPAPEGRTLEQIATEEAKAGELVVSPAGLVFHEGRNRMGFGVFTVEREPVTAAEVALYAARPEKPALGPFPATVESIEPAAPFTSKITATDPETAEVVYHTTTKLPSEGEWRLMALVRDGEGFSYSVLPSASVGQFPGVPQPGEKAPVIHTPTAADVGGDLSKIDTRQPPSSMHEVDYADAVGTQPIVLLFATPALCSSRVCGPVVDIAEEVKSERGEEAAFIHMEIYQDNVVGQDNLRPQVSAYNLPSEPWLFVIDSEGMISTAIEGAFSKRELDEALDDVSEG